MNIQVKTAVASHLSDAQELLIMGKLELANHEINYAKALIEKFLDPNLKVEDHEITAV